MQKLAMNRARAHTHATFEAGILEYAAGQLPGFGSPKPQPPRAKVSSTLNTEHACSDGECARSCDQLGPQAKPSMAPLTSAAGHAGGTPYRGTDTGLCVAHTPRMLSLTAFSQSGHV